MASLGPNFLPATVDFVLDQEDQIQGRVLDDAGKPLAGATVSTYSRHDDPENWTREIRTFGNENEVKTDADGRFVFSGLMSGGYTFNVTADGYTSTKLKHILTGTDEAEIRLSPAP